MNFRDLFSSVRPGSNLFTRPIKSNIISATFMGIKVHIFRKLQIFLVIYTYF